MVRELDPIGATERADRKEVQTSGGGGEAKTSSLGYGGPRQCDVKTFHISFKLRVSGGLVVLNLT